MPSRDAMLARLRAEGDPWDLVVVGGGATGVGTALDAASRGWRVLLLERGDFGQGTSSRSTKLFHGGVRYLRRGNVSLVREALVERELLRRNAPGLVADLELVVPCRRRGERLLYRAGLLAYDRLAGPTAFGRSRSLGPPEVVDRVPNVRTRGLRGGVSYHDGQFDDARFLLALVATAAEHGAALVNHVPVVALAREGRSGPFALVAREAETGREHRIRARAVVNATGPFVDAVRRMEAPRAAPLVAPSQGAHLVLDGSFLGGAAGVVVPRTEDGRLIFALPWRGRTLVGTTDTPLDGSPLEPRTTHAEAEFLLRTVAQVLERAPTAADVRSTFAGVRPLVRARGVARTALLSREHAIRVGPSDLVTVAGGKWTTWRRMAEDVVDRVERLLGRPRWPSITRHLAIRAPGSPAAPGAREYARVVHPRLPTTEADVVRAVREEMARTVDDVLSRRTRDLVLDARAAVEAAPAVAAVVARETGRDDAWARADVERFLEVARGALPADGGSR